jgi:hypothetical protein
VAWYVHDITSYPAVFTETTPAWSNINLRYHPPLLSCPLPLSSLTLFYRELARVTTSSCILTHVRKASPGWFYFALNYFIVYFLFYMFPLHPLCLPSSFCFLPFLHPPVPPVPHLPFFTPLSPLVSTSPTFTVTTFPRVSCSGHQLSPFHL